MSSRNERMKEGVVASYNNATTAKLNISEIGHEVCNYT